MAVAAGSTAGIDAAFRSSVGNGSDDALRLAALLPYVGIDGWYTLARAAGFTAIAFAYLSLSAALVAGIRASRQRPVPTWLPSAHRQAGVLVLALVAAHAALPYLSSFPPYEGWRTASLPWAQPESWGAGPTAWESFGIVAAYLLAASGPTWYLLRNRVRAWRAVHRVAAVAYPLSAAHAFLLGTDLLTRGAPRVIFLAAQVPLAAMLSFRVAPGAARSGAARLVRWVPAGLATAAASLLTVLAVLAGTGTAVAGMRL